MPTGTTSVVVDITAELPLLKSGTDAITLSIPKASNSSDGYLSSNDFTTFTGKLGTSDLAGLYDQPSGIPQLDSDGNLEAVVVVKNDTAANLASVSGPAWSLAAATDTNQLYLFDGTTAGGFPVGGTPYATVLDVRPNASQYWDTTDNDVLVWDVAGSLNSVDAPTTPLIVANIDIAYTDDQASFSMGDIQAGSFFGQRLIITLFNSASNSSCNASIADRLLTSNAIRINRACILDTNGFFTVPVFSNTDNVYMEFIWTLSDVATPVWAHIGGQGSETNNASNGSAFDPWYNVQHVKSWSTTTNSIGGTTTNSSALTIDTVNLASNTQPPLTFNSSGTNKTKLRKRYNLFFQKNGSDTRQAQILLQVNGSTVYTLFDTTALVPSADAYLIVEVTLYRRSVSEIKSFVTVLKSSNVTLTESQALVYTDCTGLTLDSSTSVNMILSITAQNGTSGSIRLLASDAEIR